MITNDARAKNVKVGDCGADVVSVVRRLASIVFALVVVLISGFFGLVGLIWGFGLKCDDSCSALRTSWRYDPNAWQWNAFAWVGVVGFVCAVLLLVMVTGGRRLLASAASVGWTGLALLFLALLIDTGLTSPTERIWLGLAGTAAACALAVALAPAHTLNKTSQ